VKDADKSLKKEGASIEKYNPFFFKRFSALWPRLNMKLFPGIGITHLTHKASFMGLF
jgi:hypothetical protein